MVVRAGSIILFLISKLPPPHHKGGRGDTIGGWGGGVGGRGGGRGGEGGGPFWGSLPTASELFGTAGFMTKDTFTELPELLEKMLSADGCLDAGASCTFMYGLVWDAVPCYFWLRGFSRLSRPASILSIS